MLSLMLSGGQIAGAYSSMVYASRSFPFEMEDASSILALASIYNLLLYYWCGLTPGGSAVPAAWRGRGCRRKKCVGLDKIIHARLREPTQGMNYIFFKPIYPY